DTLKKENKLQEAFNKYKTASKIETDLLKPLLEMGDLCILTDDYDKAIEFFEDAVKKFPDDIQALKHLYQVYFSKSKGLFKKTWKIKAEDILKKIEAIKNKNLVNTNDKNIK
ncbi:MAG: tetratricopeptide repeat protein, partial [Candidatus Sericytochromatia bacterium]|nr:tetratricopeptide repeat protein [Candidatus Sericytochromatia bacterium]